MYPPSLHRRVAVNSCPERASIDKVELNGCWSRASILPALDNWSVDGTVETQYVSTPSIPSDARYNEPLSFAVLHQGGNGQATQNSAAVVGFYYDGQATAARADGCRVYSAYVAEYAPYALDGREKAWVQVTVKMAILRTVGSHRQIDRSVLRTVYKLVLRYAEILYSRHGYILFVLYRRLRTEAIT